MYCPKGPDSWCKWQNDHSYEPKLSLPSTVKHEVRPIFMDLSDERLLNKCLHGLTQNVNETLNGMIWERCPKSIFIGRQVLLLGVCSAVLGLNDGSDGLSKVFKVMNLTPGELFKSAAAASDINRIQIADRQAGKIVQRRRKQLRAIKKKFIDNNTDTEGGDMYKAGTF